MGRSSARQQGLVSAIGVGASVGDECSAACRATGVAFYSGIGTLVGTGGDALIKDRKTIYTAAGARPFSENGRTAPHATWRQEPLAYRSGSDAGLRLTAVFSWFRAWLTNPCGGGPKGPHYDSLQLKVRTTTAVVQAFRPAASPEPRDPSLQ